MVTKRDDDRPTADDDDDRVNIGQSALDDGMAEFCNLKIDVFALC